jgi:hypothetical protein
MTSALEVLAHSAALQLAEKTDDNNDDDELSLDLRRQSIISSFATLSLEDSASFNSEDLHLHRHHRKDNDDDDNVVTDAADLAVIAPPAPAASGKEKAADSATELRKVFRLKADEKIVYSFRTQLLDVSLLNAHVAITPTHLCVLAALQPEPQSGYLTAGNRKYWAAIENGALCAYADRDPAKHAYAPVFRKACADIVNVNAVSVAESGADTAQPHHATRFRVSMKVDFDSMAFDAPSDGEARSWIVALRLAAQAARTPTLKRVIPLTRITSVHAPVNDFVFGGRCVTLTVGVREPEQLWFVGMPNAQEVLEQLSLVWIEQLLSPDAGFEESPADAHPLQLQFEKLFKLGGDESLRHAASASLVLKTGFLVSAQLFLSDHAICVLSNSTFSKLLAVVPWHSVTAVTDTTHLLMRAVSIATVGGRVVKLVLGDKLVREQIALMWKQGRTQTSDVRQRVDDDNAAENVDGNDSNYDIDDNDNDIDDEEESSSSSSSHESLPSAPQFHSKRDKAFHKRFGGDIPIDQSLQLVLHAYLVRSDAKHGGHMHVTQQFFAFASGDDMRLAMPRSSAIDSKVTGHTVALMCKGDLEFIFKFDDDDSAATFGSLVRATDSDTAAATPTDAAVHFYHNQLTAYRRMFSVSDDELLDTHTCSFVRAKLVSLPQAGQLFVGRNNVCFKATYAAYKIVVPVAEIADVVRQESVSMGRSGLRLQTTSGAFFLFVGFPALKKTIRQIKHVAVAYRNRAAVASATASPAAALATRALASEITSSHESPMSAAPPRPLRILILTIGSRGDVQPTIMLGRALRADGHDVTIATHAEFKEFVEKNDLKHDTLAGDPKALMNLCVSKGMFTPSFVREALTNFRQFIDDLLRSVYKVAKALAPDLMIQAPTVFAGKHVSEALHIPLMNWFTMPHTPTSRFAHPFAVSNMPVAAAAYMIGTSSFSVGPSLRESGSRPISLRNALSWPASGCHSAWRTATNNRKSCTASRATWCPSHQSGRAGCTSPASGSTRRRATPTTCRHRRSPTFSVAASGRSMSASAQSPASTMSRRSSTRWCRRWSSRASASSCSPAGRTSAPIAS